MLSSTWPGRLLFLIIDEKFKFYFFVAVDATGLRCYVLLVVAYPGSKDWV